MFSMYRMMRLKGCVGSFGSPYHNPRSSASTGFALPLSPNAKAYGVIALRCYVVYRFPADAPRKEHPKYRTQARH